MTAVEEIDTGHYDPEPDDVREDSDEVSPDLAAIAKQLQATVSKPIKIKVDAQPGFVLEYRTDLETDDIDRIYRTHRKKISGQPARPDFLKINRHVLAETCIGIYRDGKAIKNSHGETVTFKDLEFIRALGAPRDDTLLTVAALFRSRDGEIAAHADAVQKASGFGGDVEMDDDAPDPTAGG